MPVELTHPQLGTLHLETADLSDGGVFLKASAEQRPPIGEEVTLRVVGTLGGEEPPLVPARIVRHTSTGMGLEFL
jgi:hypothetical protein